MSRSRYLKKGILGSSTGAVFVSSRGSSTDGRVRREDVDDILSAGMGARWDDRRRSERGKEGRGKRKKRRRVEGDGRGRKQDERREMIKDWRD